jgi:hypothetical protein
MITRIKIDKTEIAFIINRIDDEFIINLLSNPNKTIQNKNVYDLNSEDAEKIVDKLSDLFNEVGINADYEPNNIGFRIESLIDIINKAISYE